MGLMQIVHVVENGFRSRSVIHMLEPDHGEARMASMFWLTQPARFCNPACGNSAYNASLVCRFVLRADDCQCRFVWEARLTLTCSSSLERRDIASTHPTPSHYSDWCLDRPMEPYHQYHRRDLPSSPENKSTYEYVRRVHRSRMCSYQTS